MKIGDLFYSVGAEIDKDSMNNIKEAMSSISQSFLTGIGVASASMAGLFAVTQQFAEINDELGKMARNRDVAVDTLQALEYSFKGAGLEGSKANDVLAKLQEQKEGFKKGTADFDAFSRIGINPNAYADNESYFLAVIDGLKNVEDEATKADLSKRLLGSSDMKNLIDGGSEAIRAQKKELSELGVLISEQDYSSSADFNDTLLKTMTILKGSLNKVMMAIMPIFSGLMKDFNLFLKANKELITSGLKLYLEKIIDVAKFFISLVGRVIGHLGGMKTVIIAIAGLLVLWQLPLFATIAVITAVFLAFDDLMNFIKGNDSVIGDWVNVAKEAFASFKAEFPIIGAVIQTTLDAISSVFDYMFATVSNVWDLFTSKIDFGVFLQNQYDLIVEFISPIKSLFSEFVEWLSSLFDDVNIFGGISEQISELKDLFDISFPELPSFELPSFDSALSFMGYQENVTATGQKDMSERVENGVTEQQNNNVTNSNTTTSTQTNNTYNIEAKIDAGSKSMGEVLKELSAPSW